MVAGADVLEFGYDALGVSTLTYNGTLYYYLRNAQGDITGIVNSSGTQVVAYTYDAWGNILSTTGSMATTLGTLNPFRYRSYFYDAETNLYYLNSRYYNPQWGRFISADGFVSTGQGFTGENMFAYCNNNPVGYSDSEGAIAVAILGEFLVQAVVGTVVSYAGAALSAQISGEDFNKGEALLWAVGEGILSGFASVVSPLNMERIRYLQVASAVVQGVVNGDEMWEIALSATLAYSSSKLSSADVGDTMNIMASLGSDAVEGVADIGKQNAPNSTQTTDTTYSNPISTTCSPTGGRSTVAARSRSAVTLHSNNPRSHFYVA